MNRRALLRSLLGGAAALTLDPERLLWRPGAKLISVPKGNQLILCEWLSREALRILAAKLTAIREVDAVFVGAVAHPTNGYVLTIRKPRAFLGLTP